jgi:hypothetical protein
MSTMTTTVSEILGAGRVVAAQCFFTTLFSWLCPPVMPDMPGRAALSQGAGARPETLAPFGSVSIHHFRIEKRKDKRKALQIKAKH